MRRVMIMVLLAGALFWSGCSSSSSMATFRGQKIFAGQSSDSVEKNLGEPDRVAQARWDWFWGWVWDPFSQAKHVNPWTSNPPVYPQTSIVEWTYIDPDTSLILWLNSGTVGQIWIVDPSKIRK